MKCLCVFVCVYVAFHVDVPLQAKMLAEMDEEFGIADLVSEVVQEDKNKVIITCACGACGDHVMIM